MSLDTDSNKILHIPPFACLPVGKGIIITATKQYTKDTFGESKLVLPQGYGQQAERKYDVGEVLAIGPEVVTIEVGDIVLWQVSTGFRIPNGIDNPICWKVEEFAMSTVAVLPNLDPKKRTAKWKAFKNIDKELIPYVEMYKEAIKESKRGGSKRLIPPSISIPSIYGGEIERPDHSGLADD